MTSPLLSFPLPKIRTIGDEPFTVYTFPCQKFALFVSPFTFLVSTFTERSPLWRWNSQWVHTFRCQIFFRPLCSHSFKWREPRNEWSKTQDTDDQILPSPNTPVNTKTIGNRKRDCAWCCARGINTTWENLQIEKHKSVRWAERTPPWFVLFDRAERTPPWFVLFDLQIFSGGVYPPSATSRTISCSISNSFWYYM